MLFASSLFFSCGNTAGGGSFSGDDDINGDKPNKGDDDSGTTNPSDPFGGDDTPSEPSGPVVTKETVTKIYLHVTDSGVAYFGNLSYEETKTDGKVTSTGTVTFSPTLKGTVETKSYSDGSTAYYFDLPYYIEKVTDYINNKNEEVWAKGDKSYNDSTSQYGLNGSNDPCMMVVKNNKKLTFQKNINGSDFTQYYWDSYEYNEKMKGPLAEALTITLKIQNSDVSFISGIKVVERVNSSEVKLNVLGSSEVGDTLKCLIDSYNITDIQIVGDTTQTTYFEGSIGSNTYYSARLAEGDEIPPYDFPLDGGSYPGNDPSSNDGYDAPTNPNDPPAPGASGGKTFADCGDSSFTVK